MTQAMKNAPTLLARATPEKMVTLICPSPRCRMALYMSDRQLHKPTWRCPSCGAITKNVTP